MTRFIAISILFLSCLTQASIAHAVAVARIGGACMPNVLRLLSDSTSPESLDKTSRAYVNLIRQISEKNGISSEDIQMIIASPVPINVVEDIELSRLNRQARLSYSNAFVYLLREHEKDPLQWDGIREELKKLTKTVSEKHQTRDKARENTAHLFTPRLAKKNLIDSPLRFEAHSAQYGFEDGDVRYIAIDGKAPNNLREGRFIYDMKEKVLRKIPLEVNGYPDKFFRTRDGVLLYLVKGVDPKTKDKVIGLFDPHTMKPAALISGKLPNMSDILPFQESDGTFSFLCAHRDDPDKTGMWTSNTAFILRTKHPENAAGIPVPKGHAGYFRTRDNGKLFIHMSRENFSDSDVFMGDTFKGGVYGNKGHYEVVVYELGDDSAKRIFNLDVSKYITSPQAEHQYAKTTMHQRPNGEVLLDIRLVSGYMILVNLTTGTQRVIKHVFADFNNDDVFFDLPSGKTYIYMGPWHGDNINLVDVDTFEVKDFPKAHGFDHGSAKLFETRDSRLVLVSSYEELEFDHEPVALMIDFTNGTSQALNFAKLDTGHTYFNFQRPDGSIAGFSSGENRNLNLIQIFGPMSAP